MMLANPPAYMTAAQFLSFPNDFDFSPYDSTQIQTMLNAASGRVNGILKRNLLCHERTELYYGNGSNVMELGAYPIAYVRLMQFVQPGIAGFIIPLNRVLLDALKGEIVQYSPLELQGIGFVSVFPAGLPIAITFGVGYGFNPTTAPTYTVADQAGGLATLPPGNYVVGVTTKTQWGETLPSFQNVTTATGNLLFTVTPSIGAWKYAFYVAPGTQVHTTSSITTGATSIAVTNASTYTAGQQIVIDAATAPDLVTIQSIASNTLTTTPTAAAHATNATVCPQMTLVSEMPALTFGSVPTMTQSVSSDVTPSGYFPSTLPLVDSSALPIPAEIVEATRLLALDALYEGRNVANQGVASDGTMNFVQTEGSGGKTSALYQRAKDLLLPKSFSSIF